MTQESWSEILSLIKSHTIDGSWITNISAADLGLVREADGICAILKNNSSKTAYICADFLIPAANIVDLAGNAAAADIVINACVSNVTDLAIADPSIVLSVDNTIGNSRVEVFAGVTAGQLKTALKAKDNSPQTYVVKDSANNDKDDTELIFSGDKLKVTAENLLAQRTFQITMAIGS